jgi:uncharacterized protein YjiS (DUF1127 family)
MGSIIAMQHGIPGQSWAARLIVALKYLWTIYLTWRLEQVVVNQLCSMSDRELKDIGLDRSGIVAAVRGDAADPGTFHLCR